ncbi:hypothetical protein RF55_9355 [Lasius niger]|uniref:Uncharacterized protein n=1 Tax=Lasius niger TaxID=67767 RepID=A0A0J7NE89_LASNI|nr:hypothetical protein RF55_9355 [Lasius niger]
MPRQIPLPVESAAAIVIRARKSDLIVIGDRSAEGFKRPVNVWKQKNKQGMPSQFWRKVLDPTQVNMQKKPNRFVPRIIFQK